MRHKKKGTHLGRTTSHKKALMRNMAAQVIEHKQIKTTDAKAKELRRFVEKLITYGKKGSTHHRRLAFKFLQNKAAVKMLFEEIAPTFETRNGGYTRIVKLGNRPGDAAPVSLLQLVGFEPAGEAAKKESKKKKKEEKEAKKETKSIEKEEKKTAEAPKKLEKEKEKTTETKAEQKEEKVETAPEKAEETKVAEEPKDEEEAQESDSEEKN